ncbi:MAG TPA: ABC transporter permease [Bacillota bacterium]
MFRFYLGLTFKNLFRHKRRTILTALAIAIGIFFYILFDSIMTGIDRDAVNSILDLETGHFQIVAPAPEENQGKINLKYLLPEGGKLAQRVAGLPGVKGTTPRLIFPASLISSIDELPVTGVGVDPKLDPTVFKIRDSVKGRWLRPGESETVVGKKIATLLEIKVGDTITVRTQTKQNTFQALDLTVVGIVDSVDPVVNEGQFFIPLDTAERALSTGTAVSQIAVKTVDYSKMNPAIQAVEKLQVPGENFRIKTWHEVAEAFLSGIQMKQKFIVVLLLMVALIAIIGVVNSTLLASLERVREIGILKAMGMTEGEIVRLFNYEALGLGFLGGLGGVILGVITNLYLVNVGIDLTKMYGEMNMGLSVGKMYGVWNWSGILGAFALGIVISWLASHFPARKAARVDPAVSLRRI